METTFNFGAAHFNKIFPFYILINHDMVVISNGKSLTKLFPDVAGRNFSDSFYVKRPHIDSITFESLKLLSNQLLVIECFNERKTNLRGQLDFLPDTNQIVFLGSPWFDTIEDVIENKLSLHDFAFHDSMTDLLHVMKTQENTNEDLKYLLQTVNRQKDELKRATKALHDIALFPTQNPDPLMRINFEGDLLQNNPAAAFLDFIEYESQSYRNDDFFKLIAVSIDKSEKRWNINASSNGRDYSFICITMQDEGYINIYGRDITEQKKDQQQLENLSLIIQQSINAIIVTDNKGNIEWVNKAFETVTGYSLEEVIGKKPGSLLQGEATDKATIAYMREKIKNAEPFICEIYNYKKSGVGYWLRISGQPIFDKSGNVVRFFAIEEDITKEKEAELKLEEFDKRLKIALQKIGDNVWEHDFNVEETTFSQQEFDLLGYSTSEFNNNVELWYNSIYSEDKKLVQNNDRLYRSGQIDHHSLEYRMIHKNGSLKWVLDRGVVIEKTKDNKPLKIIGTHTDITEQKAIEKELQAVASRLTSLISNLYAGVLLENQDRKIALVNNKLCDMFHMEFDPQRLIGRDCRYAADIFKNMFVDTENFAHRIETILSEKKNVIAEILPLVDGRYFQRDFIPIWNNDKYNGHLWVYTDITDNINADKKLQEQRIFYEKILDNIPSDIAVFDKEHHYKYLNLKAINDPEVRKWMVGKKDEDYISLRQKSTSILDTRRNTFNKTIETKQLQNWEEELIDNDGSKKYFLRNMFPLLDENGDINMVIGYGVDITQIKQIQQRIEQSEKQYRDVINNSLAIICTHNLDGSFLSVNPMVGKVFGYTDDEMIGHSIKEFIHPNDKALFEENYLNKIAQEKNLSGIFRVIHKNGEVLYTLFNNYLKEEKDKKPYIIVFAVDITDRVKAEKELKIAKKITEKLAESKQNFLANMSHEIRTPMNAIMGMANQLNKTNLSDSQQFYLNVINNAADNLLVIINDILDLSKIEAGKLSIEHIGFAPKLVLARVMQVMMHKAEEKGLELTSSFCDPYLNPVLIGDPFRLNQILLNLLSNAIKFTEKGGVDIKCRLLNNTEKIQHLEISVTDTGIGMDDSYVKNMFQKFSQEDESVTRKYGGTGLGMSICKELVELMGGKIVVDSKKDFGSTFTFDIILEKGESTDLPERSGKILNTEILKGKHILVTDDNEMNRLVASTILKQFGATIDEAQNGVEAIEKINKNAFDLVLMDVQMPVMDGLEAIRIIRTSISSQLPVIALTAFALKGDDARFIKAGMNDYISKPFEENLFLQTISRWLGKGKLEMPVVVSNVANNKIYNLSKLYDIAKGKESFVNKMIDLFKQHTPASVAEIVNAYKNSDFEIIKKVAHRLKPSIDNMGIEMLKNEIREIEELAESGQHSEKLEMLIEQLEQVVNSVIVELNNR